MIAIGFANVMFTLWNVFDEGTRTVYKYVKNISSDITEVEKLYPGVPVNYSLKGHYMVFANNSKKEEIANDCFQFGQYKGESFNNASLDYLFWYYGQIGNQESREILEGILTKTGKYHMYDGRLVDQKEYDWRTQEDKDFADALELVKSVDECLWGVNDEIDVYEETDPTEKLVDDSIEFGKNVMRKKISEYLLKYLPMTPDDKEAFVEEMNKNIK